MDYFAVKDSFVDALEWLMKYQIESGREREEVEETIDATLNEIGRTVKVRLENATTP